MRTYTIFSYAILMATALHIAGGDIDIGEQLIKFPFWLGLISSTGICMLYAMWISYCKKWIIGDGQQQKTTRIHRWRRFRYLAVALLPSLSLHLTVLLLICIPMEDSREIFIRYLLNMPAVLVMAFFYALALLHSDLFMLWPNSVRSWSIAQTLPSFNAQVQTGNSSIAEVQASPAPEKDETDRACFDNDSYPETLYYILAKNGGTMLKMKGMSVRFFDIVLLYSSAKTRFVILRDGEMLGAESVMTKLRKIGLAPWMLKISANYYVNMLLVQYPTVVQRRCILLQPDVMASMQPKYNIASLRKALRIGRGMNPLLIPDFLASVKALDHKGWNTFIPLD
ncbi:hypothetical protein [Sphingobacterium bambusae]|uniref:Transmembrane protein n=1 Tax=Sphingobacterium bambusae TaxID=662858 RepID=A0ABW6BL07_9SPHI|nr:hypothetical protein [Sphingobacterium bambusae]WPL47918.1 hypothetical protein SCB77_18375 [Sphingobacterium bambusae]